MIVIYISDCREIQAWNRILDDREVRKVRHECIDYRGKRVCILIICRFRIQIHYLLISRTCLEQKGRAPRAACLYVDHKTYIVEHFPVILPDGCHAHHSDLFCVGEEHLHALLPVCALFQSLRNGLENDSHTIAVISRAIRPHGILFRHRLRIS